MFRPKFLVHWFIVSLAALCVIYSVAAPILLQDTNKNIAFIERELEGVDAYKQAFALYYGVYTDATPDSVVPHLQRNAGHSTFSAWKTTYAKVANRTLESFSQRDAAEILRELIRDIGDESNLILDPELQSYYAVDILFNQIPMYLIWGGDATYHNRPMPEVLKYYSSKLEHAFKAITRHSYNTRLAESITAIQRDWNMPVDFLSQKKHILSNARTLAENTVAVLEDDLKTRLANQYHQRWSIIMVVVCFYGVIVSLIIMAVRYYVGRHEVSAAKERQKLLAQLADKNQELEKFASAAAHDLKAPVRTMRSFAMLLKTEAAPQLNAAALEYVTIIENTAQRAERMINDLLGYTQAAEEALAAEDCDIGAEFASVLEDLKAPIESIRPTITTGKLPTINTIPGMVRRVLLNIVDNALKYRRAGVTLTLHFHARQEGNTWVFSLADNGIGIPREHSSLVFEPFKRLKPELYKEGSGIGLTACKKIIERLNGHIWVVPGEDNGTVVFFSLPA